MKINFPAGHVVPALKSVGGFEAIDELAEHLVGAGAILAESKGAIAMAIKQRERSMSTGIGLGIALPHALSDLVEEPMVVFGRSKAGIDFDALDRQPVHFVAMMIVPPGDRARSLEMLAAISRLLHKQELRSALEMAADAASMADILNGHATRVAVVAT